LLRHNVLRVSGDMKNLLIGAVSTNYTIDDVRGWVTSSNWDDCERILLVYDSHQHPDTISGYLKENGITVVRPTFNFWGIEQTVFESNTGVCDIATSYNLIHNIRFFHIWNLLVNFTYEKVLITDVRDVRFNSNPFSIIPSDGIIATSEGILYSDDAWNMEHLHTNLGMLGIHTLQDCPVYNVGVFGGSHEMVKSICADIYLNSAGRNKVADQTSFNYLIQTKYKSVTKFTDISDKFAIHLHVVSTGLVKFTLTNLSEYVIIHQYDRIPELKRLYA